MARKPTNPLWATTGGNGWEGDIEHLPPEEHAPEVYDECHAHRTPEEQAAHEARIVAHTARVEREQIELRRKLREAVSAMLASVPKTNLYPWRTIPGIKLLSCAYCRCDLISEAEQARILGILTCWRKLPPVAVMLDQGDGHKRPWCKECERRHAR